MQVVALHGKGEYAHKLTVAGDGYQNVTPGDTSLSVVRVTYSQSGVADVRKSL
jgi:hypothetical protein